MRSRALQIRFGIEGSISISEARSQVCGGFLMLLLLQGAFLDVNFVSPPLGAGTKPEQSIRTEEQN